MDFPLGSNVSTSHACPHHVLDAARALHKLTRAGFHGDDADRHAAETCSAGDDRFGPHGVGLHERALVEDPSDPLAISELVHSNALDQRSRVQLGARLGGICHRSIDCSLAGALFLRCGTVFSVVAVCGVLGMCRVLLEISGTRAWATGSEIGNMRKRGTETRTQMYCVCSDMFTMTYLAVGAITWVGRRDDRHRASAMGWCER